MRTANDEEHTYIEKKNTKSEQRYATARYLVRYNKSYCSRHQQRIACFQPEPHRTRSRRSCFVASPQPGYEARLNSSNTSYNYFTRSYITQRDETYNVDVSTMCYLRRYYEIQIIPCQHRFACLQPEPHHVRGRCSLFLASPLSPACYKHINNTPS